MKKLIVALNINEYQMAEKIFVVDDSTTIRQIFSLIQEREIQDKEDKNEYQKAYTFSVFEDRRSE